MRGAVAVANTRTLTHAASAAAPPGIDDRFDRARAASVVVGAWRNTPTPAISAATPSTLKPELTPKERLARRFPQAAIIREAAVLGGQAAIAPGSVSSTASRIADADCKVYRLMPQADFPRFSRQCARRAIPANMKSAPRCTGLVEEEEGSGAGVGVQATTPEGGPASKSAPISCRRPTDGRAR